jgi:hypothetical protein
MPVNYRKTIICLANSRKLTGRCVAGKEIIDNKIGAWIRPVSARPTGELSEEERRFPRGQDPKLLDVIKVPMIGARPMDSKRRTISLMIAISGRRSEAEIGMT